MNGGGGAAHIKSAQDRRPDFVQNGLPCPALSHRMFDRGLLTVADDATILISNLINDVDGIRKILNASGRAQYPHDPI
ncbi:HNH endonuclease [Sphingomonas sp. F9_3S_D5_B_2]